MQNSVYEVLAWLAGIGGAIGLGQLLMSDEPITLRRALGRTIVTAGLSVGAAAALIWIPNLHPLALVGLGAAIGSLGTAGLERFVQRWLERNQ